MKQEFKYAELILEIINSEKFKYNLEKLNSFYANLKQEGLIRNLILEELNDYFGYATKQVKPFNRVRRLNGFYFVLIKNIAIETGSPASTCELPVYCY